jgi:hypothetical protein
LIPEIEQQAVAANTRARLTPEERRLAQGTASETAAKANLGVALRDANKEAEALAQDQLADAWATQGRFDEASKIAHSEERQARYAAIHGAVWRDDEDICGCEETVDPRGPNGTEVVLPNEYVDSDIYSEKHGRIMPLVRCSKCGDLNVRNVSPRLAELRRARAEIAAQVKPLAANSEKVKGNLPDVTGIVEAHARVLRR